MKKLLLLVFIFFLHKSINAQIHFSPIIGIDILKIKGQGIFQEAKERQGFKKVSPTIGFSLLGVISENFEWGVRTDFVKFKMITINLVDADGATEINDVYMRNAIRLNFKLKNWRIGSGINANFIFLDMSNAWGSYKWKFIAFPGNYGMSHFLSYQIRNLVLELTYQKDLGDLRHLNTWNTESFSISTAYLFKIKDKRSRKNKGKCPKF